MLFLTSQVVFNLELIILYEFKLKLLCEICINKIFHGYLNFYINKKFVYDFKSLLKILYSI